MSDKVCGRQLPASRLVVVVVVRRRAWDRSRELHKRGNERRATRLDEEAQAGSI